MHFQTNRYQIFLIWKILQSYFLCFTITIHNLNNGYKLFTIANFCWKTFHNLTDQLKNEKKFPKARKFY